MKWISLLGFLFLAATAHANPLIESLVKHGFTCTGWQPSGKLCTIPSVHTSQFNYPAPIGILIPDSVTEARSVVLHFHGFQNVCRGETIRHPHGVIEDFELSQPILESSSILVVPLSLGKIATFKSHWLPQARAARRWLDELLIASNARWILTGHSAGGYVINHFVDRDFARSIDRILLLDATYWRDGATLSRWKTFQQANPDIEFVSIYRPGTGTEQGSLLLKRNLPPENVELIPTSASHCSVPNRFFSLISP